MFSSCHKCRKIFLPYLLLPTLRRPLSLFLEKARQQPAFAQTAPRAGGEDHEPSWPFAAPARHTAPWASSSPRSPARSCHSVLTSSHPSGPGTQESTLLNCYSNRNQPPSVGSRDGWGLQDPFRGSCVRNHLHNNTKTLGSDFTLSSSHSCPGKLFKGYLVRLQIYSYVKRLLKYSSVSQLPICTRPDFLPTSNKTTYRNKLNAEADMRIQGIPLSRH